MSDAPLRLFNPPTLHAPRGYAHIAEVTGGRIVYISGQIALNPDGQLVGAGDLRAQAEQVFANLKLALAAVGADFRHVAKLTYFLVDAAQMPVVREVRDRYLDPANPPASSAVEVRRLVREDLLLEIEAVAVIP